MLFLLFGTFGKSEFISLKTAKEKSNKQKCHVLSFSDQPGNELILQKQETVVPASRSLPPSPHEKPMWSVRISLYAANSPMFNPSQHQKSSLETLRSRDTNSDLANESMVTHDPHFRGPGVLGRLLLPYFLCAWLTGGFSRRLRINHATHHSTIISELNFVLHAFVEATVCLY